jgi:hypothetical protein
VIEWLREFIQKKKIDDIEKYKSFFIENITEFKKSTRTDLLIILLLVFYKINFETNKIKLIDIQYKVENYYPS